MRQPLLLAFLCALFLVTTPPCEAQVVHFEGLAHAPLGGAQLTAAQGNLLVTGMASANDGVSIDLGFADGHDITFAPGGPLGLGDSLSHKTIGFANGGVDVLLQGLGITGSGGVHEITFDAPQISIAKLQIDVYNGAKLLATDCLPSLPTESAVTFLAEGCVIDICRYLSDEFKTIIDLEVPGNIDVIGSTAPVVGDRIVFTTTMIGSIAGISEMSMTGNLPLGLLLKEESIVQFGSSISSLGGAKMKGLPNALLLSSLGASGLGGVDIDLKQAESAAVEIGSLPLDWLNNARMTLEARGSLNGVPDQPLGAIEVKNVESFGSDQYVISADFGNQPSPVADVLLLDDGQVVLQQSLPLGAIASTTLLPFKMGKLGGPILVECFLVEYLIDTPFVFPGSGVQAIGDELQILLPGPSSVDFKSTLTFTTALIPQLVIQDITVESACANSSTFADGCAPAGTPTPLMYIEGCPSTQGGASMLVTGPFGASMFMAIGATEASLPLGYGCELNVVPLLLAGPFPLNAQGELVIPMPPLPSILDIRVQGLIPTQSSVLVTNGLAINNGI